MSVRSLAWARKQARAGCRRVQEGEQRLRLIGPWPSKTRCGPRPARRHGCHSGYSVGSRRLDGGWSAGHSRLGQRGERGHRATRRSGYWTGRRQRLPESRGFCSPRRPPQPGRAHLTLDYSEFASAYGGGWSGRLGLVPAAGLRPDHARQGGVQRAHAAEGEQRHRRTDPLRRRRAAPRPPPSAPTVLALAATSGDTSASGAGDYSATPLAPSSTWEAGGSSGSFTWSYPHGHPARCGRVRLRRWGCRTTRAASTAVRPRPTTRPPRSVRASTCPPLVHRAVVRQLRQGRPGRQVRPVLEVRERLARPQRQVQRAGQGRHEPACGG